MSAYEMVSLHSDRFELPSALSAQQQGSPVLSRVAQQRYWDTAKGWKHLLSHLRWVMQSFVLFNLVQSWLDIFPMPRLSLGFPQLITVMNQLHGAIPRAATGGIRRFYLPRVMKEGYLGRVYYQADA